MLHAKSVKNKPYVWEITRCQKEVGGCVWGSGVQRRGLEERRDRAIIHMMRRVPGIRLGNPSLVSC